MFKSIFRKFKKSKESVVDGKEKNNNNVDFHKQVAEEISIKTKNPKNIIEQDMSYQIYPVNQNSINNTTDMKIVSVENKKKMGKTTKFKEHKDTYSELFSICKTMDEVIEVYTMNTSINDLYDELRLRYLNMYIFNRKLRGDKLNKEEIIQLIKDKGI